LKEIERGIYIYIEREREREREREGKRDMSSSAAWRRQELQSVFPAARTGHSAILNGDRLILFGGHGHLIPQESRYENTEGTSRQYGNKNDICIISLRDFKVEWLQPALKLRARNRVGHKAVNVDGDMYVFGGWAGKVDKYLNFGFLFDTKSQQLLVENSTDRGRHPSGRRDHTLTLAGAKIYLFGGWNCVKSFNDLWTLDFKNGWSWVQLEPLGNIPGPRRGHSATAVGKKIFLFGGIYGYTRFFNDLYCFDTVTKDWKIPEVAGKPPSPRAWHAAVRLADTPYILIIGGSAGRDAFYNDVHALNTESLVWMKLSVAGAPPSPRCSHTAVIQNSSVYVFGGLSWQSGQLKPSPELFILDVDAVALAEKERQEFKSSTQKRSSITSIQSVSRHENSEDEKSGWLRGWMSVNHLRKGTWKLSYFKITPFGVSGPNGTSIRQLDWHLLIELDLNTPQFVVEETTENLELPLVMLLAQSKFSARVQEYLKASKESITDEYPEFYLAVEELDKFKFGSAGYLAEAKKVYEKFLMSDGERMLSNVPKRDSKKIKDLLDSGKLSTKDWKKPLRSALITMREQLRDFLQNKQERRLTMREKMQRMCTQCGVKFSDLKLKRVLCMYCLGVFCADCRGDKRVSLPVPYKKGEPEHVCKICYDIFTENFETFCITGFSARKTGLFEAKLDSKSKHKALDPPYRVVIGVKGKVERDLWIEALRKSSVKAEGKDSESVDIQKEGFVACRPLVYAKDHPVVWTHKYAVLNGAVLRLLDLKFKEVLPLNGWEVHSFNIIEPTLGKGESPPWLPTKTSCAYQFSVSNRNKMFKLGADSAAERFKWIKSLQKRALAEKEKKRKNNS